MCTEISNEQWRDVREWAGYYQVSDMGRVKSLARTVACGSNGRGRRVIPETILKPYAMASGHLTVALGNLHDRKGRSGVGTHLVHRLVMEAFVGNPPEGQEVRHINGDPADNRLDNLCYGSRTENILDVYRQGKRWRKLDIKDVQGIRKRLRDGEQGSRIAKEYGISQSTVSKIKLGQTYWWLE